MVKAAKRYADAMLSLAIERNKIDEYFSAATTLSALREDAAFTAFFNNPAIPKAHKTELISIALKDALPPDFMGLFQIITEKGRESELFDILTNFRQKVKAHNNIAEARVTTAAPLTASQEEALKAALSAKLNKQVTLTVTVDKSLIAGLKVMVGGKLIDATAAAKLADIRNALNEGDSNGFKT